MNHLNAVVLDLEMTGLSPKTDKIIEIGALKVREGEIVGSFERLLDPGRPLEPKTVEITGITDEMLHDAPEFADICNELLEFLGEDILLGHNIIHDFSFLKRAVINVLPKKSSFERRGVDTLKIARGLLPAEQKKTLPALCAYYGILHQPHRASDDARATLLLYNALWQQFGEESPDKFLPRPLLYQVKRDTPVMPKQIAQIERLLKEYHIEYAGDLTKMTKSEASRFIDRMKAVYGSSSGEQMDRKPDAETEMSVKSAGQNG